MRQTPTACILIASDGVNSDAIYVQLVETRPRAEEGFMSVPDNLEICWCMSNQMLTFFCNSYACLHDVNEVFSVCLCQWYISSGRPPDLLWSLHLWFCQSASRSLDSTETRWSSTMWPNPPADEEYDHKSLLSFLCIPPCNEEQKKWSIGAQNCDGGVFPDHAWHCPSPTHNVRETRIFCKVLQFSCFLREALTKWHKQLDNLHTSVHCTQFESETAC